MALRRQIAAPPLAAPAASCRRRAVGRAQAAGEAGEAVRWGRSPTRRPTLPNSRPAPAVCAADAETAAGAASSGRDHPAGSGTGSAASVNAAGPAKSAGWPISAGSATSAGSSASADPVTSAGPATSVGSAGAGAGPGRFASSAGGWAPKELASCAPMIRSLAVRHSDLSISRVGRARASPTRSRMGRARRSPTKFTSDSWWDRARACPTLM